MWRAVSDETRDAMVVAVQWVNEVLTQGLDIAYS